MLEKLKGRLNAAIDAVQASFPPNRVAVLLAPLAATVGGALASWVASSFPGLPPIDPGWIAGIFVAGAAAALIPIYKWIDGWQKAEARGDVSIGRPARHVRRSVSSREAAVKGR